MPSGTPPTGQAAGALGRDVTPVEGTAEDVMEQTHPDGPGVGGD